VPDESAPRQRLGRPGAGLLLDVPSPHPVRSMLILGWPMILAILIPCYLVAILFPVLGALLLIGAPLAVLGAFAVAAVRARKTRLTVTDELVRVTNGVAEIACDRAHVESAVLVDSLSRRRLAPRTTDLILLDVNGRTVLLLSGLLWPRDVLEQVISLITPAVVERVPGRQTPASLAAQFPNILQNADGIDNRALKRQSRSLVLVAAVAAACLLLVLLIVTHQSSA